MKIFHSEWQWRMSAWSLKIEWKFSIQNEYSSRNKYEAVYMVNI